MPGPCDPDFIERNGTWILSMLAIVSAGVSGLFMYMLKSRCSTIKCCGAECQRDVVAIETTTVNIGAKE